MTAGRVLNGALIGCGFFADNHLHAWREVEGARIAAVCDIDAARAERAAGRFGIERVYHDARSLLESQRPDFVDIVTTMDSHRALVELAAAHAVPAIVQKPFAPTLEDAQAMVRACADAGVALMVHENFRFQAPLAAVREALDSGVVGEPFFGRVSFRHGNPVGYENQPYLFEQPRYIINDVGIHTLDVARFYFGEVRRLYAEIQRVNPRFKGEDVATLLLRHVGGATSIVDLSVSTRTTPDPFAQTLVRIEGTRGTLELAQDYRLTVMADGRRETRDVSPRAYPWSQAPWDLVQDSVVAVQRHWVECLREARSPSTSGADNLRSLALTFAAYESAERGCPVITG